MTSMDKTEAIFRLLRGVKLEEEQTGSGKPEHLISILHALQLTLDLVDLHSPYYFRESLRKLPKNKWKVPSYIDLISEANVYMPFNTDKYSHFLCEIGSKRDIQGNESYSALVNETTPNNIHIYKFFRARYHNLPNKSEESLTITYLAEPGIGHLKFHFRKDGTGIFQNASRDFDDLFIPFQWEQSMTISIPKTLAKRHGRKGNKVENDNLQIEIQEVVSLLSAPIVQNLIRNILDH